MTSCMLGATVQMKELDALQNVDTIHPSLVFEDRDIETNAKGDSCSDDVCSRLRSNLRRIDRRGQRSEGNPSLDLYATR